MDEEKLTRPHTQSYTRNYRQIRKAGHGSGGFPQRRAHQWVFQCQVVSSENIHTNNIVWTEGVIVITMCVYTHTCVCNNNS